MCMHQMFVSDILYDSINTSFNGLSNHVYGQWAE